MHANSQTFTVSGKVTNQNNEPLASASVLIKKLNKGTSTNFDGKFQLNVSNGDYIIEARFIGFATISKKVNIANQNVVVNFSLQPENNVLDEVLVSAVRVKTNSPITHSNLSKKEIAKRNLGQDIPSIINFLPSVVTTSDAGGGIGYTSIRVRGSDATRVNVTINGIAYNDSESQGTFWVNLGDFASSTESLQLQRGVGTSTNGSGAFGASLNILTDAVSKEASAEISNSFGSFNTRKHTVKFNSGLLNDHFELVGRLSNIESDGYVDRASTSLKSYFLQGSFTDENTLIKILTFGGKEKTYLSWNGITQDKLDTNRTYNPSGEYTDSNGNTQFYDNETDNYWQDHYQLHWNQKLTDNWSTNIGLNFTKGQGYYEQFKENEEIDLYNGIVIGTGTNSDNESITDLIRRRWLDNKFYVANFSTTYKKDGLEIISGISYSNYNGDHFGEVIWARQFANNANIRDRYYFGTGEKKDFSMFSKATFTINEKWRAFIDLQSRFVNYKTTGVNSKRKAFVVNKDFNFFNPKAGLTYKINTNNSLYTSFARANREPNRDDFKGGVTEHESLNDFELGWRHKVNSTRLNANVYYMNYQNQLVLTGALDDTGGSVRATSGSSYRLGLEVDAFIPISNTLSLQPNIAISRNKNRDFVKSGKGPTAVKDDTNISFSPNFVAGNILTYKPINDVELSLFSKFVGSQYLNNIDNDDSKLASYFVNDFNFNYEIKTSKALKSIVFSGLINNVFNVKYVSNAADYGGGYIVHFPQATRNFLVGVTLKF